MPTKDQKMIVKTLNIPYCWKGSLVKAVDETRGEDEDPVADLAGTTST